MNAAKQSTENPTSQNQSEKVLKQGTEKDTQQFSSDLSTLMGGLAHEIKNPLSTIRLTLELLGEEFANEDSPKEARAIKKIGILQRECQRLQDVLDDFLHFTKVRPMKFEVCDLNALLESLTEFYRPQANQSQIEIILYLASDLPSVFIDQEVFRGALLNLFLNAQQAMTNGGQLVLRTTTQQDRVRLDVIDTGSGMDAKTLAHIFEAFYSTKEKGTGLGLSTVEKIIRDQRGEITVQSEPNRGTQFTILLPQADEPSEPASQSTNEPSTDEQSTDEQTLE